MPDGMNTTVDTNLGPTSLLSGNAIGLMSDLAEMRNRQNANTLFLQQMSARHQMGDDAAVLSAQGLNDDQILDKISKSPYAPFVAPEIGMFRQAGQARVGMEVQKLAMWHDSVSNMIQSFAATGGDRSQWAGTYKGMMAGVPPEIQGQTKDAVEGLITSLTAGMPQNGAEWTPQNQDQFNTRLRNLGVAFGMPLDKAYAIQGGVAPVVGEAPTRSGATQKGVFSGTSFTPMTQGRPPGDASSPLVQGASNVPPPGSPLVGPSATQSKYLEARGTDTADYRQRLDTTTTMGAQILKTIEPAWDAMKSMKTGGGAEFYSKLGQVGQALGLPQDLVDKVANGNLAASQEMQKLMVNTTMGQITQQLPNMSRLAQVEYTSFTQNNPNLNTDPRAIEKIFNFWTSLYKQSHEEQTGMDEHLAKGGDVARWPTIWQDIAQKKGYVNTNITGTAKDEAGAVKLPEGAKVWRKNAETGKWE